MKLSLIGYFDIGLSFGIDDTPFEREGVLRKFREDTGLEVGYPRAAIKDFPKSALGNGLRIFLTGTEMVKEWHKAAATWRELESFLDPTEETQKMIAGARVVQCYLDAYSIGLATIRLDLEGIDSTRGEDVTDIYCAFEFSAYEILGRGLKSIAHHLIDALRAHATIENISLRKDLRTEDDYELLPGFTGIFICEPGDDRDFILHKANEYEREHALVPLNLDEGMLHFGWACCVVEPHGRGDQAMETEWILSLIQMATFFFGVCKAFEELFARRMSDAIKGSLGKSSQDITVSELYELRILAEAAIELTGFHATTINISALTYFDAFEGAAKMPAVRGRIKEAGEVFLTVQDNLIRIEEQRRKTFYERFIFFITSLTFISVMADILNTVDYVHVYIQNPAARFFLLISPPVLLILLLGMILTRTKNSIRQPRK